MSVATSWKVVLLAVGIFSCLTLKGDIYKEPMVTIENNYFISAKNPQLVLKIDDDLNYLGHLHEKIANKSATSNEKCNRHIDSYVFIDETPSRNVTKVLEICIESFDRPNWYFFNDLHDRVTKNKLIDMGKLPLAKEDFNWAAITGHYLYKSTVDFIRTHQHGFAGDFIAKTIQHTIGMKGAIKLTITFCKSTSTSGISGNINWTSPNLFTDDQKKFIRTFLSEANDVFMETGKEAALNAPRKKMAPDVPMIEDQPGQSKFDLEIELKKLDAMKNENVITEDEYKLLREGLIKKVIRQ